MSAPSSAGAIRDDSGFVDSGGQKKIAPRPPTPLRLPTARPMGGQEGEREVSGQGAVYFLPAEGKECSPQPKEEAGKKGGQKRPPPPQRPSTSSLSQPPGPGGGERGRNMFGNYFEGLQLYWGIHSLYGCWSDRTPLESLWG